MKKALIAGCSHTTNLGLKATVPAWYDYFAIDKEYSIHNIAQRASSLEYMIHKITEQLYNKNYDLILFQLTTVNRFPIPTDGDGPFMYNDFTTYQTPEEAGVLHLTEWLYMQSLDPTDVNAKKTFKHQVPQRLVKFIYEKFVYSRFNLSKIVNSLYLLQQLCDKKGIKLILIPHDHWNWGTKSGYSVWKIPNSSKIDKKYYIEEPFLTWLKENYNLQDYFLDKGFHLNAEGHKIFYNEYLKPNINKLLL